MVLEDGGAAALAIVAARVAFFDAVDELAAHAAAVAAAVTMLQRLGTLLAGAGIVPHCRRDLLLGDGRLAGRHMLLLLSVGHRPGYRDLNSVNS
ncbi:MAG: hypothetical protein HY332_00220 [Chloroflexi bacterium]|nr:hypothetical protein [Chloroflexota bacterium]